jgi:hypothetical protein
VGLQWIKISIVSAGAPIHDVEKEQKAEWVQISDLRSQILVSTTDSIPVVLLTFVSFPALKSSIVTWGDGTDAGS